VLDVHRDADHGRSVFTLAGEPGRLAPDFGPPAPHPTAGATLVAARPPLVAFNLVLDATLADAERVAAELREGGAAGLPGVRALGLALERRGVVQLSTNVEDPVATPLRVLVAAVRERVPVREAELVGLAPAVAFEGFPEDVPIPGFDPERHLLERALA
jgi:glutamate formiminotransferase / 5-formyltetrahydrofolate cyclo-ligase